jgi:hypothetical protein
MSRRGCGCCGGECFCGDTIDGEVAIKFTVSGLLSSYDMSGEPSSWGTPFTVDGLDQFNGTYLAGLPVSELNCQVMDRTEVINVSHNIVNSQHGTRVQTLTSSSSTGGSGVTFNLLFGFGGGTPGNAGNYVYQERFHCWSTANGATVLSPLPETTVTFSPYVLFWRQAGPPGTQVTSSYQFTVKREFVVIPV